MTTKKCIAVVGEVGSMRGFMGKYGEGIIHGGWTNEANMVGEIRALQEMGRVDTYGVIVVDMDDWRVAEAMGERIHDELTALGVTMHVVVLDDRRIIEKKPKVTMVPRKAAEVVGMARMFGIIE